MDRRMVDFVQALRAEGVRVSLAESEDAFRATGHIGIKERDTFRSALRLTLVKEETDIPVFERLFPLFFGLEAPPALDGLGGMGEADQEQLLEALRQLAEERSPEELKRLLENLLRGQPLSREELDQLGQQAGLPMASRPGQGPWMESRMMRAAGLDKLMEALREVLEKLAAEGMGQELLDELAETAGMNREALEEQIRREIGAAIARRMREDYEKRDPLDEVMELPFRGLDEREIERVRDEVRRLAARLRSRAALRHRRARKGQFDMRATLRANQRYGGVPLELKRKHRVLKPKLILICDVSTSVRHCAEFMLTLIYELQDQVARARSFAFIDRLLDISHPFDEHRPQKAVAMVLDDLRAGHYNTDLGASLADLCRDHMGEIDRRTTVIFLGDGRNNFNDPRLDCMDLLKGRAKRIVWMNPEAPYLWGTGDSDMPEYQPYCDALHEVGNLAQLAHAVERLFDAR
ncbi:MAG: VWA domain-containing protein [bacterium]|nr:VWA domain-containing protein [bacterium]